MEQQKKPKALAGLKVVELGGGAAGPIAIRHLADHGATVIRIESASRPDFLRVLGLSHLLPLEPTPFERF